MLFSSGKDARAFVIGRAGKVPVQASPHSHPQTQTQTQTQTQEHAQAHSGTQEKGAPGECPRGVGFLLTTHVHMHSAAAEEEEVFLTPTNTQ
jgi:hypothetical protein